MQCLKGRGDIDTISVSSIEGSYTQVPALFIYLLALFTCCALSGGLKET